MARVEIVMARRDVAPGGVRERRIALGGAPGVAAALVSGLVAGGILIGALALGYLLVGVLLLVVALAAVVAVLGRAVRAAGHAVDRFP